MDYLPIFVAVTSVAVVIQAGILVALFVVTRKTTAKVEELANQVVNKAVPLAELAHSTITELRPKIDSIAANVSETTTVLRPKVEAITENVAESSAVIKGQLNKIDATLTELLDRARLQVIRTDEMVTSALDKVEDTTESVQRTVRIPIRQFSGLMRGVSAGFEYLVTKKRRDGSQPDEMFI